MNRTDSQSDRDRLARVALNLSTEPGDPTVADLVDRRGAETVASMLADGRLEKGDPAGVLDRAAENGIRYVTPTDPEWPHQLDALRGCDPIADRGGVPLGLWVKGNLDLRAAGANSVAVTGSRACTGYGAQLAGEISGQLARQGRTVLSGAGFGIDQAAHAGALATGGATVAVLPCGVDRAYPTAHTELLDLIVRAGLLVSEAPPGAAPTRTRFLARNRILAGLGEGTLVVEAAARSGALNTGNWTSALARPLLALPGPVTSATSTAVHQLIRAGTATLVTSADDIVTDIDRHCATTAATPATAPGIHKTPVPLPARRQDRADRLEDSHPDQLHAWLSGAEDRRAADPHPHPDTPAGLRRRLTDLQPTHPDPAPGGPRP